MTIEAELLDLRYASRAIGPEYQAKQLGHEVVEFRACARIRELGTLGASPYAFLHAARAHLAPGGLRVLVTPIAFPIQVGLTGTAIKPATGDKFGIRFYMRHIPSLRQGEARNGPLE